MDNITRRNTTPAVCPHCGARQQVDPAQDAVICPYCGAPFSVERAVGAGQRSASPGPDPRFYGSPGPGYSAPPRKKRHIFWWVVGWLVVFPVPLTILLLRNRRLPGLIRFAVILLGWAVWLGLGLRARTGAVTRTVTLHNAPSSVTVTVPTVPPVNAPRPTAQPAVRSTPRPTNTPAPTPAPAAEPETETESGAVPAGVTPEFKAAMDSFEAFFDEYADFMKAYSESPDDLGLLLRYADFLSRYTDTMDKLDAIDESELSPADDAYYLQVMARIDVKLLEAAQAMG